MRYTLLHIITLFLLLSCSGKTEQEERYAEIVSQWQGREIKLPAVMTDFLTGDTINLDDADFTILTYVDSTGCTGCKMKLPIWKILMSSIDSIPGHNVTLLTVVQNEDKREVRNLLKGDNFRHPVVLDSTSVVNGTNLFPEEFLFNTFLLDKHHRVLAIGNPAYIPGVATLYRRIIRGDSGNITPTAAPISVSGTDLDVGTVKIGDVVSHNFQIANNGSDTLHLRDIVSSCDCTTAIASQNFIEPSGSVTLEVKFKGDKPEMDFFRTVDVFFTGYDNPTTFEIHGNVIN